MHDALDTGVTGAAGSLSATTVTIPGAVLKRGTHWNDAGNGRYTASTVVTGQKASLKLSGWSGVPSAAYSITAAPPDASKSTLDRDKASNSTFSPAPAYS